MAENDGKNDGGLSAETIQRTSAWPAVDYLLKAIPGTPVQRALAVARVIQDLFPEDNIGAHAARSALESFCVAHKLNIDVYLKPMPMQVNFPISVTS